MNPILTTNLAVPGKEIENSDLTSTSVSNGELSDELFKDDFTTAMENILPVDGNIKPLDLAALTEQELQQLVNFEQPADIELSSQLVDLDENRDLKQSITTDLKQPLSLKTLPSEEISQIENVDLFGNPEANVLLESTNLISNDSSEEGIINKNLNKTALLPARSVMADAIQQSLQKNDADVSNFLDDVELSQNMKIGNSEIDAGSELFAKVDQQEIKSTKFIEQLTNLDKPLNTIATSNSHSIKTTPGQEQAGALLNRIEVPVNQPGWSEAVGNRMMMMINGKVQSANIHINPAELGPIEIRVNVNHDHQTSVHIVASNSVVRNAIEDAFPQLKEMFTQNGLSLADANVSQQSSQQGGFYSNEQNSSLPMFSDESIDTVDTQLDHANNNVIDISLINHYV